MSENVVKTEIKLSEESVHKIVVSETAKALLQIPNLMETMVHDILFYRVPKQHSYDKENPTFYERVIQKTIRPIVEEEIKKMAQQNRNILSTIIKKAFKTKIIDNKAFEDRLIEQLAKTSHNPLPPLGGENMKQKPSIVCLCGSTYFYEVFQEANLKETLDGKIVLTIGCDTKSDYDLFPSEEIARQFKAELDELHLRKIDLADEVLILNVGGYIGNSTRRELEYAKKTGKKIRFWEPEK